ncbi:MAG TPA: radical SAM protein [Candidatus Moranbacteria bacterium]|nr:radical SAM protein [Candidatus Moranbacteria bacterium]
MMKEECPEKKNRIYLQWHLTNKCNNGCKHCYQHTHQGEDVRLDDADAIIGDFLECCDAFDALPVIALTGGDPMLHNHFWDILAKVKAASQSLTKFSCVSILGNPELLDERNISMLAKFNLKHFQLSIDGMEKKHDEIRYKGSFQRTMQAIRDLSKAGIPVYIMSTLSAHNFREMFDVMKAVYDNGAQHWMFARWVPNQGDCGIPANEYMRFIKKILEEHLQYEKKGYKQLRKEPLIAICRQDSLGIEQGVVSGGCGMGSSTMTMLPDKTLMACRRHPGSIIGKWSPKSNFLYHFVDNPKMEKYRRVEEIEGCRECKLLKYCRGCRAVAYVATGSDFKHDPQCLLHCHK